MQEILFKMHLVEYQQDFFLGKLRKFYLKGGVMKEIFHALNMMMTSSWPTRQESGSVYPSSLS